jgi:hypothetical protein
MPPEMRGQVWKSIKQNHKALARMLLVTGKQRSAAEAIGMSEGGAGLVIRKNGHFKEHMDALNREADEKVLETVGKIGELVPKALEVYREILHDGGEDARLKFSVASDVLDRGGIPKSSRNLQTTDVNIAIVTNDDIADGKRKALDAARASGLIIDVDSDAITPVSKAGECEI